MADTKVRFKYGTKAQYDATATKDKNTLYWLTDVNELYWGDELFGTGRNATELESGLLSPDDKNMLTEIADGTFAGLTPVDGTIVVNTDSKRNSTLKVGVSAANGNALTVKSDGLFVDSANIQFKGGSIETSDRDGFPFADSVAGDKYMCLIVDDANSTQVYMPVPDSTAVYTAGNGIDIAGGAIGVKIDAANANGLKVTANGLAFDPATSATISEMAVTVSSLESSCTWVEASGKDYSN